MTVVLFSDIYIELALILVLVWRHGIETAVFLVSKSQTRTSMKTSNVNLQNESNVYSFPEASNLQVTLMPESELIINDRTISLLKQMFCDKDAYRKHISVLWTIRGLLHDRLLTMDENSFEYQSQIPLFDTLNLLISSIQCQNKERLLGIKRI